jgi:DNA-binding transcriptional regulator GbsR (MarR family)
MSQGTIYSILSDVPMTQKEIGKALRMSGGLIGHRLASLQKKGLIEVCKLDRPYRPNGYSRKVAKPREAVSKWPRY